MKFFGGNKAEPAHPKPPPKAKFGVPLRKGVEHVVNGERVFYPYSGAADEPDDVIHELSFGKHVVDGVIAWVHRPPGFRA
jgi:hypothetical protein